MREREREKADKRYVCTQEDPVHVADGDPTAQIRDRDLGVILSRRSARN